MNDIADLAARLRLHRSGREWRGGCPSCGYAGAFVLTEGKGGRALGWCASCQDTAGIAALIADALGGDRPVAESRPDDAGERVKRAARIEKARMLWGRALPALGTLAATYLAGRGLPQLASSEALRFAPDCGHPSGSRHPALIAAVRGPDGGLVAVHRTYLRDNGAGKADIEPAKASLGPIAGGAIRLHAAGPELILAEGVETAGSAALLLGLPGWSAITAGNLVKIELPALVRTVVIAADPDPPGIRAAKAAARRWVGEGRKVRIALPNQKGHDFNDIIKGGVHVS